MGRSKSRITIPDAMPAELAEGPPPPANMQEALRGMVNKPYLATTNWQQQQWRALRQWKPTEGDGLIGAHPKLLLFEKKFQRRLQKLGIPMFAANMVRSAAWQAALKAQGVSKTTEGAHNYGCAFDLVHSIHGWNLQPMQWQLIGHLGKEVAKAAGIKVVWGGDWSFYDPAHWELANWRDLKDGFPFVHPDE